jgi:flagellar hook-associated protein 2
MAQITSSVGLVSGINTGAIIDALLSLDQAPISLLQTQVSSFQSQQQAYTSLETQLSQLQMVGKSLELPATFRASTATSSNTNVLTATTSAGAPSGTYQFQVAQLVSAQQSVSNGYASTSSTLQAGTITLELGGGSLSKQTSLAAMNGGAGVASGQFRITDRSGKTDVIDTSGAVTLDDIVSRINTSLNIGVQASVKDNHLVLNDTTGGTGTLQVQDVAGGTTAQSLGIVGSASGSTLTGSSINYLSNNTALSVLNDSRGIRLNSGTGGDLSITAGTSTFTVNLNGSETVGDVLSAINKASNGTVQASLASGATGITLQGQGGATVSVSNVSGSHAAEDLGIASTGASSTITGKQVLSGIDTVLLSSLNGGQGLSLGQLSITNRATPPGSTTVDLSGATTVQNVLDAINTANAGVTASLNQAGNGIQLTDTTGGTGNLTIGDADASKTAEALGLAGTFDTSTPVVNGGNLHLQYVTQNTTLSSYNGGKGVGTGKFTITNAAGVTATIDTSAGTFNTIGDVMKAINSASMGVTASIDPTGNGIVLTDSSGGPGHMMVQSVTGTTANDLHLTGTATGNTIDGTLQTTIQVKAGDTLATVQQAIQAANFGIAANIINDGSASAPYRLSLTATHSGTAGQVVIDTGTTGLRMRTLVQAQDAAVYVGGGSSGSQPLLVTSNTNQLTNVIPGVTVSLLSASTQPVSLTITPDGSGVEKQLQTFTDTFNTLVDAINTYTAYDTSTNTAGLLLGDPTTQEIQTKMYQVFSAVVSTAGQFRTLGDVGLTLTDGAKIQFDATTFENAFASNPDAVRTLFSQASTGLGSVIDQSMTALVDPVSGAITEESQTLTNQSTDFKSQITQLDSILADKKAMLQQQFANMETTLATLQSQQAALGTITGIKAATSSSSGSSGSSSGSSSSSSSSSSSGSSSGA